MCDSVVKMFTTRNKTNCPIFGAPLDLSRTVLPTREEVLRYYNYIKLQKQSEGKYKPKVSEIFDEIATELEKVWKRASIPTVHHVTIINQFKREYEKLNKLLKSYSEARKGTESFKNKASKLREDAALLFDIAYCKCKSFEVCVCDVSHKVPPMERAFLQDQRTTRAMIIGGADRITTEKIRKKDARKLQELKRLNNSDSVVRRNEEACSSVSQSITVLPDENYTDKDCIEETLQPDIHMNTEPLPSTSSEPDSSQNLKSHQTRMKLATFARTCDRYGIADRPAAALASALMYDLNQVANDVGPVIDRSKVRRERKKLRLDLQEKELAMDLVVKALYFDGRKDRTISMTTLDGGKSKPATVTEEHISVVNEPGSSYLGHVSPISGSAQNIKNALCSLLTEKHIDTSMILAVGCDGTVTNTGSMGGIICLLEKEFGRHLHWVICQLHSNELPLRHLIEHLDGTTSGPRGFSGAIGKNLPSCEQLPIVKYRAIGCVLPDIDKTQVSTDQKYLFDISTAVSSGECPASLASRSPGKLSHARWLTTANRILRLYVSTPDPSANLIEITTFVNRVYAPMWFHIKTKSRIKDASLNLWRTINFSRYLKDDLRKIVDTTIQRNGFFAHPESLLVAMLADDRRHIRELSVRRILSIRAKKAAQKKIRKFEIPKINFSANDYIDLINWQDCVLTEPSLTQHITDEELHGILTEDSIELPLLFELPCHTQAVERCVKVVSEASLSVCGPTARDGFIRTRLLDRNIMPIFETKRDYKPK